MERKTGWLREVLNDASTDVNKWPPWLKDKEQEAGYRASAVSKDELDTKTENGNQKQEP